MKKHLVLLLLTVFSLHFVGCTSSDEATSEDAAVTDESLENVEGTDAAATPEASAEGFSDEVGGAPADAPPADGAIAEAPPAEGAPMDAAPPAEGGDVPPADPTLADAGAPGSDTSFVPDAGVDPAADAAASPPPAEEVPPPAVAEAPQSEPPPAPTEAPGSGIFEEKAPPKAAATLKKVETTPFRREGVLLNGVYVARPGDNYSKISKMIYGDNSRSKELKKVNPGLSPKVGDKVYYNSASRPDDEGTLKVYWDEAGTPAETYVLQEGEDFRKKAKELLGYDGAWKEVYVTNSMDSTRKVPAGTEIKFWKGGATAVAANNPPADTAPAPPAPPPADIPPPPAMEDPMAGTPPPPAGDIPPPPTDMPPPEMMAENPPPPPPPEMAPPPPPPPPPEMAPPPPPPAMAASTDDGSGGNDDLMLALAGGGGVAALLAGLMVMRKRRQQREMAAAFGDTQVGT